VNPARWQKIKSALHRALELQGASRQAYLDEITANDVELKLELESLIQAHEGSTDSFLNIPAAAIDPEVAASGLQGDARIGNYRLVCEIGSGGMGQVWLAEQMSPVRRLVALKLIRAGMYDASVAQRFQAERQTLAIMDHPAIAKVFDAGSTQQGQPYFVMEYVPGLAITEYCDQKKLSINQRVDLFIRACEGVQHAHQKAIIHRDLKPANILIIEVDGKPMPRIIDFGVARSAAPRLAEQTLQTQFGQFIGTPGFMSPEQMDIGSQDIDTRTDVYSLGVILYVLLAGLQPFERAQQRPRIEDWLRQLRDQEAPTPFAKLNGNPALAATAAARSTEPSKLLNALRGDLEWITLKALERDRERRYGTPSELSADLLRYLNHEPVIARPTSAAYRVRKFVRRHRVGIAAASVLATIIAAGFAAISYEASVAAGQRDLARQAQRKALTQTAAARLTANDVPTATGIVLEVLSGRKQDDSYPAEALSVFHEALAADAQLEALTGHTDVVWSAAFSPDGARVASASWDGTARVWDVATGQEIWKLVGHQKRVNTVRFSPDGRRVLTTSFDQTARIWDAASGRELIRLTGHAHQVMGGEFSPDGQRVVTVGVDRTARIWDASTGNQLVLFAEQPGRLTAVAFSPDGQRVATAADDKNVRIWNAVSGQQILLLSGHTNRVWSVAFSPDGQRLVSGSEDKSARIWDANRGLELLRLTGHADRVNSAQFSPDGQSVVTASDDKTVRLWDTGSGREVALLSGHTGPVWSVSFSTDGKRLVSASNDRTVRLWDISSPELLRLNGHTEKVLFAAYSPDGTRAVTGSFDYTARIWDTASGQELARLAGHTDPVNFAGFSPDGTRVVTASDDQTARVWDPFSGKELLRLKGHKDRLSGAAFSPDGSRIATASLDKTVGIWDALSGRSLLSLAGHTDRVLGVAYSPDGRLIASASLDNSARLWEAATGRQIAILAGHTGYVFSVEFSADGRQVVTSSYDHTARIWDVASAKETVRLSGHTAALNYASFSRDGQRVITASEDGSARIWDARTGQELGLLTGHAGAVSSARFSPDGNRVLTSMEDKTARIWNAQVLPIEMQVEWAQAAQFDPLQSTERAQLGLAAPSAVRRWPQSRTKCDEVAGSFHDPERRAPGVASTQIINDVALAACDAAANGSSEDARRLYQQGRVQVSKGNFAAARHDFEQALDGKYRSAQVDLGLLLASPHVGTPQTEQAVKLLQAAWGDGIAAAGFELGNLYEHGIRVPDHPAQNLAPDNSLAWQWYQKAAAVGQPNALARLAEKAENDAYEEQSVERKNLALLEAFKFYAAAAHRAYREDWPDDAWQPWRYRRASLARMLARAGMMRRVAEVSAAVGATGVGE
jgi:WD40 repeat protein/serine/threonine protein kinase